MRRKLKHSFLGAALVAATVVAPSATTAGAQTTAWGGFTAISAPSNVNENDFNESAAFSAAVTEDLGGDDVDLWVNNHAESSETLVDFAGGTATASLFASVDRITQANDPANESDSHGGSFSDIDGDGDEDFIETSGNGSVTRIFENNNGVLEASATLGSAGQRARTVLMVDIDNDGDMMHLLLPSIAARTIPI